MDMRSTELLGWACAALLIAGIMVVAALPPGAVAWALAAALVFAWGGALLAMRALRLRSQRAEDQARELRRHAAQIIDSLPGGFALYGTDGLLVTANSRFRAAFPDLSEPGQPAGALPAMPPDNGAGLDHRLPGGDWFRLARQAWPSGGFTLSLVDVTSIKQREEEIARREARQRVILNMAPVGIWELDAEGRTLFANPQTALLLGGSVPPSLEAAQLHAISHGGRSEAAVLDQQRLRREPIEVEHCGGEGEPRRLLLSASAPPQPETGQSVGHTHLLTLLDITERRAAQAQAERLAWRDAMTGLGNRAMFLRAMEDRLRRGGLTLLSIELGGLGRLNERHGHGVGDAVLRAAATRLVQSVRAEDEVFRVGGNKFCVLASELDLKAARWLGERLQQMLLGAFRHGGLEVGLTPAVGVARCPPVPAEADALRRAADLARQRSAIEGRVVHYGTALGDAAEHRHRLREALTGAIAAGEFRLHWQPQYDAATRRLLGAEALLRWHSTALGQDISPAELLPAAADIGMLEEIDLWVLEEALTTWRRWRDRPDAPPVVAINISGASLREPGFADLVTEALGRHDAPPHVLEIEIPEDVPARDLEALAQTLEALCSHGVRLSLDDFGGGASSMAHLVQLPVNRLKLDRSIVRGLPDGARESAVLRAVAAVARSLEIEILGEGVETEEQAAALLAQGCTLVQGFLYGRPMPADALVPPLASAPGP